jgi:hypothetical protein
MVTLGTVVHAHTRGHVEEDLGLRPALGKSGRLSEKYYSTKEDGGMTQVLEQLPSKL